MGYLVAVYLFSLLLELLQADQKLSYALMHCDPRKEANLRLASKTFDVYASPLLNKIVRGIFVATGDIFNMHTGCCLRCSYKQILMTPLSPLSLLSSYC